MTLPPRKSFSAKLPTFQIAWDSTSLGALKTCARKYELSIVRGFRGRDLSVHLRYGLLYHRALEIYDHQICLGASHDEAVLRSIKDLWTGVIDRGERVDPETGEVREAAWLWQTGDSNKTVPNLFRTVIWYLERFGENDPAKTLVLANGKPAVELSFRMDAGFEIETVPGDSETILLSGHLDRVVEFSGDLWVLDRKTTKSTLGSYYFDQYSPNNQMTLYSLAGKVVLGTSVKGVIIDAAQIAVGFSRFERGFTLRTESQLEEWMENFREWVEQAHRFAQTNFWPMNDTACHQYGGCPFRGVCNKSPEVREKWLADFGTSFWDPLQTRGDI